MSDLEKTSVRVDDGSEMTIHVARPSSGGGRKPGVLVFQEAFGVNHHIAAIARRFADDGYVAAAPELFHRTGPGFEGSYTDFEAVRPHVAALTTEGIIADVRASHAFLGGLDDVDASRLACIGFCMGGRVSYLAAATVALRAAISFYGSIAPELFDRAKDVRAPFLMFWGGLDKHIPPERHRALADALRAADKPFVDVEFSFADHGFNCDERASYNPEAARHAWALVRDFLSTHM
jgi:carboxymethylenebutenolidase